MRSLNLLGGRQRGLRRDPAPSRMGYRLHRILLTPIYRKLLRLGLPVFVIMFVAGLYFGNSERREGVVAWYETVRAEVENRPEFRVTMLSIAGASSETDADIRELIALDFPVSSFALDLEGMRQQVMSLDAVAAADVRVRTGGILEVAITERLPVVVWRNGQAIDLLDETGHRVASVSSRTIRPDLPLIAGPGAEKDVGGALALLAAAEPLRDRVRGLVRMGERRWDLVLDRNQRILLPEDGAIAALERVIALDQAEDLLDRDVAVVDMRNQKRPTLRLAPNAFAALRGETKPKGVAQR